MDANILSNSNVLIYFFIQTLTLLATLFALFGTVAILRSWDFNASTPKQYKLENRSYLVMVVILFVTVVKITLFAFFAYMVDDLSNIIPGAMCAAGVIEDFDYSNALLGLKLAILLLGGVWIVINSYDLQAKTYPHMKIKSALFVFLALGIMSEYLIELYYINSLSTALPVSCCTDIFGASGSSEIPFGMDQTMMLVLFYATFVLVLLSAFARRATLAFFANIFFVFIAYYAVVQFFGTYIYQQPTHKCPYCMLQKEYYYIGYLLWSCLFLGAFFGITSLFIQTITKQNPTKTYRLNAIFTSLFTLICTLYVVSYYFINGVWL
ncbi:MAG: hypothetical protein ACQESH_02480 [Campylobacterota bacterium]